MCGIFCIVFTKKCITDTNKYIHFFKENIIRRGPDCFDVKRFHRENLYNVTFGASVLWTQGEFINKQPLESHSSVLVYNGDIFEGLPEKISETGDSSLLLEVLENSDNIPEELSRLQGPYAFILLDKCREVLHFGRDVFGRTSLLLGKCINGDIIITSVAKRSREFSFIELPSIGTFSWDLKTDEFYLVPFQYKNRNFQDKLTELEEFLGRRIYVKDILAEVSIGYFTQPTLKDLEIYESIKDLGIEQAFLFLLHTPCWLNKVLKLKELLQISVDRRISTLPKYCQDCITDRLPCQHSLVGILFSGGVDCAALAVLADQFTDKGRPIDLLNVAFDEVNNYETPDRQTGRKTLEELKTICPGRMWNFLEINISQTELDKGRKQHIADLIYPLNTIMDDSLGCALWFASRGKNNCLTSPSRVLLAGMGADELFGGYTKHRAAFKKNSWLGLHESLNNDWQNLPHRNLARDDRVVCDHGRLLRTPYLDEMVIEFVRKLPCWEKTYPTESLPLGFGEKVLLRSLAFHLGLKRAAMFKKRALQFGSRIANNKEKANEISERLCL